jgi:hypothetical protein
MSRQPRQRNRWRCSACTNLVNKDLFTTWLARRSDKTAQDGKQVCDACYRNGTTPPHIQVAHGWWSCAGCKSTMKKSEFSVYLGQHPSARKNHGVRCNACERSQAADEEAARQGSLTHVQKRKETEETVLQKSKPVCKGKTSVDIHSACKDASVCKMDARGSEDAKAKSQKQQRRGQEDEVEESKDPSACKDKLAKRKRCRDDEPPSVPNEKVLKTEVATRCIARSPAHVWCFKHTNCKSENKVTNYGCSVQPSPQRLHCKACGQKFRIGSAADRFWLRHEDKQHPFFCSSCEEIREPCEFSERQRSQGSAKVCKACTQRASQ